MNPVSIIVGRCFVGVSNRTVIREVVEALRVGHRTWRTLPKEQRKKIMRYAIAEHGRNRASYASVMGGGWGYVK